MQNRGDTADATDTEEGNALEGRLMDVRTIEKVKCRIAATRGRGGARRKLKSWKND
jgi:hypothetical protein